MSKIRSVVSTFLRTEKKLSKRLIYKSFYEVRQISKSQMNQFFAKQPSQRPKNSFLGNQVVDNLTSQVLEQYQGKIKQIRQEQVKAEDSIRQKYDQQVKSLLASEVLRGKSGSEGMPDQDREDQFEQKKQWLQVKKLQQILNSQQLQKNHIQKLTDDYRFKFGKARKQYELQYVKSYMLENMSELKQQEGQEGYVIGPTLTQLLKSQASYIPNQLVLKKLAFKTTDGKTKQVLLAGIEQKDQDHCVYLKKLIEKLKIKDALTMMPPDMPYFIKTQRSFTQQWAQFIKTPSPAFKFYLNPHPKNLGDIRLSRNFIPLALNGMTKSKSFYQTAYSLMQLNEVNFKYEHQPLYSGLVSNTIQNVYFCDYPFLKQREMMALNVKLEDLRQLIKRFIFYRQQKKQNFSAELLLPKNVVQKKFRHIIKLAKTISLSSQVPPILICDASIAQVLSQEWKKSPPEFLQFDYSQNQYFLDLDLNSKTPQNQVLFIEFIEKLVILDIILKPLIQKYFVKYQSFPYSCRNTLGGKQNLSKVFLVWKHYFQLYSKAVEGKFDHRQSRGQFV